MSKPLDEALDQIDAEMFEQAKLEGKLKPFLDRQLKEIQKIDNKIKWFEDKSKELEAAKQFQLRNMSELLDTAMVSTHSLSNGFTVKPDNKRKVEVKDIAKFMGWLKKNKEPQVVFNFFKDAMKITNLKEFCQKEANEQRLNGEIKPSIDGIEFGDITYTKLTTLTKKKKEKK